MCRLYAILASEPTKAECGLVRAQNALLAQSRSDSCGVAHPDGWGVAYYANTQPIVERQSARAAEDLRFTETAMSIYARVVVAHVRRASVGLTSERNVHPFTHGSWSFAHNGTITAFERIEPWMKRQTSADLLPFRRGETDSERAFYWILSELRRMTTRSGSSTVAGETVGASLRRCILRLVERCEDSGASTPPGLNFVLTDGRQLVASRWNRPLFWVLRTERGRCEVCETCHCKRCQEIPQVDHGSPYTAVVIASEPITRERWNRVPEGHVLAVDQRMRVELLEI